MRRDAGADQSTAPALISQLRRSGKSFGRSLFPFQGIEIRSVVALAELAAGIARYTVDLAAAGHRRACKNLVRPSQHGPVFMHRQELAGIVLPALHHAAIPGPDRHIRNRIFRAGDIFVVSETAVEDVELPLRLHGVAVDGIFDLLWRIGVEM